MLYCRDAVQDFRDGLLGRLASRAQSPLAEALNAALDSVWRPVPAPDSDLLAVDPVPVETEGWPGADLADVVSNAPRPLCDGAALRDYLAKRCETLGPPSDGQRAKLVRKLAAERYRPKKKDRSKVKGLLRRIVEETMS